MPLTSGTKLGPYEIVAPIGAGGMGEVYRARDTKLGRDVAVKVLPESFAQDAQRMARFEREAKVLASLSHPNIAPIYGFEDSGKTHALVMELVEGPTLADRIKSGAIPIEEALPIAKQICEAVEYAHERGIVHRDLKPSNIKISQDGQVKVLDFGLAKALEGDTASADLSNSPTLTAMATRAGFLLGTAAYMSPEQTKGKSVDRRTDIWAFGCVLYEMLTGKLAFGGETVSDTLAAVIRAEPEWSELPSSTPQTIRNLLRRCLQKDPRQRLQAIGDARIAVEETLSGAPQDSSLLGAPTVQTGNREWIAWTAAALLSAVAVVFAAGYFLRAPRQPDAVVAEIEAPPDTSFGSGVDNFEAPALSPDGKWLAFAAVGSNGIRRLWVRELNSPTARVLDRTEGASSPFWSPDSRSLGFFANGKLARMDIAGGSPFIIANAETGRGGSWAPDGTILFPPGRASGLFRVSASGGSPQPVTQRSQARGDFAHRWPQFLPDGKHFLFFIWSADIAKSAVYAGSLDGGEPKLVLQNTSNALYAPPGYLLFVRQGTLMAAPFDLSSLQVSGEMEPLTTDVSFDPSLSRVPFTASENGVLTYVSGMGSSSLRLLWFDRTGKQIGQTGPPGFYETPHISPQGDKLAVSVGNAQTPGDIWVFDLLDGLSRRINFTNSFNVSPQWSADGKILSFVSNRGGTPQVHLYKKPSDGSGTTVPLFDDKVLEDAVSAPAVWTRDGRYLLFGRGDLHKGFAMPLFGDRKPFVIMEKWNGEGGEVSPDGKWLAYGTRGSGEDEVVVVPFPRGAGTWQVSTNGGTAPHWRSDGKELFYLAPDNQIMAAEVSGEGGTFTVGQLTPLFRTNSGAYDVSPDGKKFIVVSPGEQRSGQPLTLVVNWPALLKKQ